MAHAVTHLRRSILRVSRAVAVSAVVCLLAALCGRAEASCGDWLAGHGRMEPAARQAGPFSVDAHPVARPLPTPAGTLPARPVCDGPACRGIPPLPVIPGGGVAIDVVVDPACLVTLAADPERPAAPPSRSLSDCLPLSAVGSVPTPPPRPAALPA